MLSEAVAIRSDGSKRVLARDGSKRSMSCIQTPCGERIPPWRRKEWEYRASVPVGRIANRSKTKKNLDEGRRCSPKTIVVPSFLQRDDIVLVARLQALLPRVLPISGRRIDTSPSPRGCTCVISDEPEQVWQTIRTLRSDASIRCLSSPSARRSLSQEPFEGLQDASRRIDVKE